jgi:NADPH:quinone reductase-like Zn-dependent oxidoreductase
MKAARVHRFGEQLRIDDVDEPSPGGGEVLAEVRFAAVNPQDVWVTRGTVAGGRQPLPIFEILPLQSAPEAHRRILARSVTGKLLLQP